MRTLSASIGVVNTTFLAMSAKSNILMMAAALAERFEPPHSRYFLAERHVPITPQTSTGNAMAVTAKKMADTMRAGSVPIVMACAVKTTTSNTHKATVCNQNDRGSEYSPFQ
jgi:hypothetical protein